MISHSGWVMYSKQLWVWGRRESQLLWDTAFSSSEGVRAWSLWNIVKSLHLEHPCAPYLSREVRHATRNKRHFHDIMRNDLFYEQ